MDQFLKLSLNVASSSSSSSEKASQRAKQRLEHAPWVEKYRPREVKDVVSQGEVVSILNKCLAGEDLPNLLFYGGPGTGKTSTILAMAREMFGEADFRDRVLELNASDERGIDIIRTKVKGFSQRAVPTTRSDGLLCPRIKLVILDEADSMTRPAQEALRRIIEVEAKTTRFCLICNYISRIIDPITSRFAKFRFKPLTHDEIVSKLRQLSNKENVLISNEALSAIVEVSEGDLRRAITYLQTLARLQDTICPTEATSRQVYEVSGTVPTERVDSLLAACHSDSHDTLEIAVKQMLADGYSSNQLFFQIHDKLLFSESLQDGQKSAIAEKLITVEKRLIDGGDEYLNLLDLCSLIMHQICHA